MPERDHQSRRGPHVSPGRRLSRSDNYPSGFETDAKLDHHRNCRRKRTNARVWDDRFVPDPKQRRNRQVHGRIRRGRCLCHQIARFSLRRVLGGLRGHPQYRSTDLRRSGDWWHRPELRPAVQVGECVRQYWHLQRAGVQTDPRHQRHNHSGMQQWRINHPAERRGDRLSHRYCRQRAY